MMEAGVVARVVVAKSPKGELGRDIEVLRGTPPSSGEASPPVDGCG